MNEQEYRKRLLVQRIESQRELVTREFGILKESSPVAPVLAILRTLDIVWSAVSPRVTALTSGISKPGKFLGFDFTLLVPLLVPLVRYFLRRK